jgi:hypothetical protein
MMDGAPGPGRPTLEAAVAAALDERPAIERVADAAHLADLSERLLHDVVAEAMLFGDHSWADIGRALGVTRQAAFQRFRRQTG